MPVSESTHSDSLMLSWFLKVKHGSQLREEALQRVASRMHAA